MEITQLSPTGGGPAGSAGIGVFSAPSVSQRDDPRLASAAHEFEASLMQEFLKPLQHDALFAPEDGDQDGSDEGSESALMSFGSQAMAKAISERGGFGIATKILDHFRTSPAAEVRGSAVKL